jgi:hypothetical protein
MRIYIDESGVFVKPDQGGIAMQCVAALTVSESDNARLLDLHGQLVRDWKPDSGEIKGSRLSERQFNRLLTELSNLDVIATVVGIDMAVENDEAVTAHKLEQAKRFRKGVEGPEFLQSLKDDIDHHAAQLEQLPNQLYIQSAIQSELIYNVFQTTTLHYAQTNPSTLGSFQWVIDAKGLEITEYEELWTSIVKPITQSMSLRDQFMTIREFDYSAMQPFNNLVLAEPPDYLKPGMSPERRKGEFHSVDIKKVLRDTQFKDSKTEPGLQFADCVANAFTRACNGRLQARGWRRLGQLMIRDFRTGRAVKIRTLNTAGEDRVPITQLYRSIIDTIDQGARDWDVGAMG